MVICTNCRHPWEPTNPTEACPDCGTPQSIASAAPDPFQALDSPVTEGNTGGASESPLLPPPLPTSQEARWDPPQVAVSGPQQAPSWSSAGSTEIGSSKTGMSTGAKVAIGVGIGFLVLVGLAAIAGVAFFRSVAGSDEFQAVLDGSAPGVELTVDHPIGTCFDAADPTRQIACEQPHSHEVFALWPWLGDSYPDYNDAWFAANCDESFEAYVGINYYESALFSDVALPSTAAWNAGDHNIRCIAYEPGSDLTSSIRGAGY